MKLIKVSLLLAISLTSAVALAMSEQLATSVVKVRVTDPGKEGGCMIKLANNPSSELASCKDNWLTLSCSGDYNPKDVAYRKLDQAQMALVAGKQVLVTFTDNQKHDGYCFLRTIDVY